MGRHGGPPPRGAVRGVGLVRQGSAVSMHSEAESLLPPCPQHWHLTQVMSLPVSHLVLLELWEACRQTLLPWPFPGRLSSVIYSDPSGHCSLVLFFCLFSSFCLGWDHHTAGNSSSNAHRLFNEPCLQTYRTPWAECPEPLRQLPSFLQCTARMLQGTNDPHFPLWEGKGTCSQVFFTAVLFWLRLRHLMEVFLDPVYRTLFSSLLPDLRCQWFSLSCRPVMLEQPATGLCQVLPSTWMHYTTI